MIASRFVTFYNSLINSKKTPVRFLARLRESDQRTVLGRTLAALRLHCKVDDNIMLSATLVKKYLVYKDVPEDEAWRIQLSQELLKCREGLLEAPGFTSDELDDILRHTCVSWGNGQLCGFFLLGHSFLPTHQQTNFDKFLTPITVPYIFFFECKCMWNNK